MKTTYFLKLEIELAELKLKLAHHRLDKHHALQNEKYDQAADTFTYHVQKADRKIYRPQLERFLEDANLALQSKTKSHLELSQTDTEKPTQTVIQTPTQNQSATADQAFQEHFSHTFVQLTALHEKLMDEGKYEEAGKVLEMSLGVVRWLGE